MILVLFQSGLLQYEKKRKEDTDNSALKAETKTTSKKVKEDEDNLANKAETKYVVHINEQFPL